MGELQIILGKAGFFLFAIGLLIGVVIPKTRNPRMALAAHLTGVQTGPALIAFASFWKYLSVPEAFDCALIIALIASSYVLVAGIYVAAATGASRTLPIAGAGYFATERNERIVTALVGGSGAVMTIAVLIICYFALFN